MLTPWTCIIYVYNIGPCIKPAQSKQLRRPGVGTGQVSQRFAPKGGGHGPEARARILCHHAYLEHAVAKICTCIFRTGLAPTDISGVAYAHGISPELPSPMTHNDSGLRSRNNSRLEMESPHKSMMVMPGFTDMEKKLAPGQTALMSDRLASGQTALASPGPEIEYSDYPTPQQANMVVSPGPGIEYSDYATPQPSVEAPLMSLVPPSSLPTPSTPSTSRESVTKAFDEVNGLETSHPENLCSIHVLRVNPKP